MLKSLFFRIVNTFAALLGLALFSYVGLQVLYLAGIEMPRRPSKWHFLFSALVGAFCFWGFIELVKFLYARRSSIAKWVDSGIHQSSRSVTDQDIAILRRDFDELLFDVNSLSGNHRHVFSLISYLSQQTFAGKYLDFRSFSELPAEQKRSELD